jgi:hypothetical protein
MSKDASEVASVVLDRMHRMLPLHGLMSRRQFTLAALLAWFTAKCLECSRYTVGSSSGGVTQTSIHASNIASVVLDKIYGMLALHVEISRLWIRVSVSRQPLLTIARSLAFPVTKHQRIRGNKWKVQGKTSRVQGTTSEVFGTTSEVRGTEFDRAKPKKQRIECRERPTSIGTIRSRQCPSKTSHIHSRQSCSSPPQRASKISHIVYGQSFTDRQHPFLTKL